ncbi:hypothetical protein ACWGE0_16305 [Lentzea sp. NPDC054927]
MKYFVIQDGGPVPLALVRADYRGEEQLTGQGEWTGSNLLDLPQPGWTVAEVDGYEFYDHVLRVLRAARAGLPCLAVFHTSIAVGELPDPTMLKAVMRRRDGVEEWLDQGNIWRAEQRDLDGQKWLPISDDELERFKWEAARPSWFVVHDGGAYPFALVRKIPSAEEVCIRDDLVWRLSDLLGRTELRVEELSGRSEAADVRAAIEIGVRAERLRAGTQYFALWYHCEFEPVKLHSVFRRTEAGDEIHAGHRGWLPSAMVRVIEQGLNPFYRALPVSAEEAEAVIAGQGVPRTFLVLSEVDGSSLPVAVVRLDGHREEAFTRDLGWGPSDLLTRVADEGLLVEELPPGSTGNYDAYRLAVKIRLRRRAEWTGAHWYYAILPNRPTALQVADAIGLIRTNAGDDSFEEEFRDGEWGSSHELDDLRTGRSDNDELPISPDEAERLKELLRGGRRP